MNSFHLTNTYAAQYLSSRDYEDLLREIEAMNPDHMISVRGEWIYPDDDEDTLFYRVSDAPEDANCNDSYIWRYIDAASWLAS